MKQSIAFGLAGAILLGLLSAPVVAADIKVGSLTLKDPYSRATPKGAKVGAGYLEIRNDGDVADRLVSVACDCAEISEVHQMTMTDGVMRMRALTDGLEIPAGETVVLKPGGYHLMFIHLKGPFEADAMVKATLTFEHAGPVEAEFKVEPLRKRKAAGDSGHMDHKGHGKAD